MPGDSRAQVGFIGFNSALHFIQFGSEENSRAHVHVVTDIDGEKKAENLHEAAIACVIFSLILLQFPFPVLDAFLPVPEGLMTSLHSRKESINTVLDALPALFRNSHDNSNALGAALQVAFKLVVRLTTTALIKYLVKMF